MNLIIYSEKNDLAQVFYKYFKSKGDEVTIKFKLSVESIHLDLGQSFDMILILSQKKTQRYFNYFANQIRKQNKVVPLFQLIEDGDYRDIISALTCGCDDALSKGYSFDEIDARFKSLLRRAEFNFDPSNINIIKYGDIKLNLDTREALRRSLTTKLTIKEHNLLLFFLRNPERLLTRTSILYAVWGKSWTGDDNLLDVYIRYLRKKINREGYSCPIKTIRNSGYLIEQVQE